MIFYFAFGLLNIGLLFLLSSIYGRKFGLDLFPGRMYGDKVEMILTIVSYFLTGHFGTIALCLLIIYLILLSVKKKY